MSAAFIWQFSFVSVQFLRQRLKKQRLSRVQKEVAARKHPQREWSARLLTPGVEIVTTHPAILQAAKAGNAAGQRRLGRVRVTFVDGEICPQNGNHDLHELRMFQQLSGSTIQATQLFQESSLGQGMDRLVSRWNLRRGSCRDEQPSSAERQTVSGAHGRAQSRPMRPGCDRRRQTACSEVDPGPERGPGQAAKAA